MKNANKEQHKSQNGFMALLLFLKILQWQPEIWAETAQAAFAGVYIGSESTSSFPVTLGWDQPLLLLLWRDQANFWLLLIAKYSVLKKQAQKSLGDQGRPRPKTGTGVLWNRYRIFAAG